jgi:methyltransferase (TIGR00027 family)
VRRGEPSLTAFGAAKHRAAHQDLEGGRVFADPLAWRILGLDREPVLAAARARSPRLRLFIAVRHRFAEDSLARAVGRGTRQAVVLGAGLDTFAYRNPHPGLAVLEVDHPDTGAWKQERLAEAGIEPGSTRYVGVDFERDDLVDRLVGAGFDPGQPAFFLWLGVVPYLSADAVAATLGQIAAGPGAGEVVLDYPARSASGVEDAERNDLRERVAAIGEPIRGTYDAGEMATLLDRLGFDEVEDLGWAEILPRFLGVDPGPHPAEGGGRVVRALSSPRP